MSVRVPTDMIQKLQCCDLLIQPFGILDHGVIQLSHEGPIACIRRINPLRRKHKYTLLRYGPSVFDGLYIHLLGKCNDISTAKQIGNIAHQRISLPHCGRVIDPVLFTHPL